MRLPRRFAPRNDSRERGGSFLAMTRGEGKVLAMSRGKERGGGTLGVCFFLMFWVAVAILFLLEVICLKLRLLTVLC